MPGGISHEVKGSQTLQNAAHPLPQHLGSDSEFKKS